MTPKHLILAVACLASACLPSIALGQDTSPKMPWQRNLSDALAISKRTGKPLLLCVNMNGEVACERIAAGRYRNPKFVALAEKFIPVLASPNRHTEHDYDEHGHRIPCPKFGRITCSEHINIEPSLYKRYFNERRVAPRHVGISPEGTQLFDLFLLPRLGVIDDTLKSHGETLEAFVVDYDSMKLKGWLKLTDHDARLRVEKAFIEGSNAQRKALTLKAGGGEVESPEILRLAHRDSSPTVRRAAFVALAKTSSVDLLPLFIPAIAACESDALRKNLLTALGRIAKNAPDSEAKQTHKFLSAVYTASQQIDFGAWQKSLAEDSGESKRISKDDDLDAVDAKLNQLAKDLKAAPDDKSILLKLAEANLHYGKVLALQGSDPTFLFEDARSSARRALKTDPNSALAMAYVAEVAYMLNEEKASELAALALTKLAPNTKAAIGATLLNTFAKLRTQALYKAIGEGAEWPASWISDIHDCYKVLAQHAAGSEDDVAAHSAFLAYLKAYGEEKKVIAKGLKRFPSSTKVHQSLRARVLREGGPGRLVLEYAALQKAFPRSADIQWFAAYANVVAAEQWVDGKQTDKAIACYTHSLASFALSYELKPSYRSSAVHFCCLALAGRGRLHLKAKRYELAMADLSKAVQTSPGSVDWKDGLGRTPRATARLLRRSLSDNDRAAMAESLETAWAKQGISLDGGR